MCSESQIWNAKAGTKREKIHSRIRSIAEAHGVTLREVLGPDRLRRFVRPRHEAMLAIATEFPELSFPHLGRIFGRDHSTVMYACTKLGLPPRALQWQIAFRHA